MADFFAALTDNRKAQFQAIVEEAQKAGALRKEEVELLALWFKQALVKDKLEGRSDVYLRNLLRYWIDEIRSYSPEEIYTTHRWGYQGDAMSGNGNNTFLGAITPVDKYSSALLDKRTDLVGSPLSQNLVYLRQMGKAMPFLTSAQKKKEKFKEARLPQGEVQELHKGEVMKLEVGMQIQFLKDDLNAPIYIVKSIRRDPPELVLSPVNQHTEKKVEYSVTGQRPLTLGRKVTGFGRTLRLSAQHAEISLSADGRSFMLTHKGTNPARIIAPKNVEKQLDEIKDLRRSFDFAVASGSNSPLHRVQVLEQATQVVNLLGKKLESGYDPRKALGGYEALVHAFELLHYESLNESQVKSLTTIRNIMNELSTEADTLSDIRHAKGNERDVKLKAYVDDKMKELKEKDEIYLNGGFDEHYNIVRIRRETKNGQNHYTSTLYDAGGEAETVRKESMMENGKRVKRDVVNAVVERRIRDKPGMAGRLFAFWQGVESQDPVRRLVELHALKYITSYKKTEYDKLCLEIRALHQGTPLVEEDYRQRHGNCTVRAQRVLKKKILGKVLAENVYQFVSDPENLPLADMSKALAVKEAALKSYEEQRFDAFLERPDPRDSQLELLKPKAPPVIKKRADFLDPATYAIEKGRFYLTQPGKYSREQLNRIQVALAEAHIRMPCMQYRNEEKYFLGMDVNGVSEKSIQELKVRIGEAFANYQKNHPEGFKEFITAVTGPLPVMSASRRLMDVDEVRRLDGVSVHIAESRGRRDAQEDTFFAKIGKLPPEADIPQFFKQTFAEGAEKTKGEVSGSTGTVVYMRKGSARVDIAHVGDSPVLKFIYNRKTHKATVVQLTNDHTPESEREAIQAKGGVVLNGRVKGENGLLLKVGRAFGDAPFGDFISKEPDITTHILAKDLNDPDNEVFLMVSCDGLLERSSLEELRQEFQQLKNKDESPDNMARKMAAFAYNAGSEDNLTAMMFQVVLDRKEDIALGVFDGHNGSKTAQMMQEFFSKAVEHETVKQEAPPPVPVEEKKVKPPSLKERWQKIISNSILRDKENYEWVEVPTQQDGITIRESIYRLSPKIAKHHPELQDELDLIVGKLRNAGVDAEVRESSSQQVNYLCVPLLLGEEEALDAVHKRLLDALDAPGKGGLWAKLVSDESPKHAEKPKKKTNKLSQSSEKEPFVKKIHTPSPSDLRK